MPSNANTGSKKRTLVLFDLDGTLTYKDSMLHFILKTVGWRRYISGLIASSRTLLAYKLGRVSNSVAKQKFLAWYFQGWRKSVFQQYASRYAKNDLPRILRQDAMDRLHKHLSCRDDIVVVSASIEDWIRPWCEQMRIGCIATKLESNDGILSGQFDGENCHGAEKVVRIKQCIDLSQYANIIAYGDSSGDQEMLSVANEPHFKCFSDK